MSEKYAHVPVSLIQRAHDAIDAPNTWTADIRAELAAYLSQPTPTAQPKTRQQRAQEVIDRNERNRLRSAPPSIADMVPGATFVQAVAWTVAVSGRGEKYAYRPCGRFGSQVITDNDIDPSTIRDVTPPEVTS